MLTRSHISRREGVALMLLIFLPLGTMAAITLRAVQNERIAVKTTMQAELERTASEADASFQRELSDLTQQLQQQPQAATWSASAPFVHSLVIDDPLGVEKGVNAAPRRQLAHPKAADKRCAKYARHAAETARSKPESALFLNRCEGTRSVSGRFVWPLVALHPNAVSRPTAQQVQRWMAIYSPRQRPAERQAQRAELSAAPWLTSAEKQALLHAPHGTGEAHSSGELTARDKLRRRPGIPQLSWSTAQSRGAFVRDHDGRYVGFVIDRVSLQQAINAGWPAKQQGMSAYITTRSSSVPHFAALADDTVIALRWRGAARLDERAGRSRTLLVVAAAIAAIGMMLLVWLLWSRLRAQRQLNALRTDFVAAVSHELRTPIASLRMLSELLADDKLDAAEVPTARRAMVQEAARLGDTVDQLLSFSRMQAGKLQAKRAHCDISALVEEAIEVFERRHGESISRTIEPGIYIQVDPASIKMALRNLLDNARKHAPNGTPYEVELRQQHDGVMISVADRGPGIPAAFHKAVFAPFERVDDRLSEATEGSGIGLSLVRHVARSHGGHASVESKPQQGARFKLWLPNNGTQTDNK